MPGQYLVDEYGNPIKASNPLPVTLASSGGTAVAVNTDGSINVQGSGVSLSTVQITIPSGGSLPTNGVDLGAGKTLVGIIMPAAWTTADLTFQASATSISAGMANVYNYLGGEQIAAAAASRHVKVYASDFVGIRYLNVRSGTSGTPVNQAADRILTLVVAGLT